MSDTLKFLAIIPARYASTRFPGKPLAILDGKCIIEHVYQRVCSLFDDVYVATDDARIAEEVEKFGGKYLMTSSHHQSGTDRCYEALYLAGEDKYDVVINIQGDEPFIAYSQLQTIKECFSDPRTKIATLVKPFPETCTLDDIKNPNSPKVVISNDNFALYFSRSIVPYVRGCVENDWPKKSVFYKHIGIYAYKSEVLKKITSLQQSNLEQLESLEQLRWLQAGYAIKVGFTNIETIGIDTPEDLQKAQDLINKQNSK